MKKPKKNKDGWVPVRRGKIYCSPACGGNCTHKEFLSATRKANALAKELGVGWKPVVRENLGWNFRAVLGVFEVFQDLGCYTAFFNGPKQFIGSAETPRRAVLNSLHEAREGFFQEP